VGEMRRSGVAALLINRYISLGPRAQGSIQPATPWPSGNGGGGHMNKPINRVSPSTGRGKETQGGGGGWMLPLKNGRGTESLRGGKKVGQ